MTDRIASKVYETKNYDKFNPFKGNRGATPSHVRNLAASIKERGWIDSLPMSCRKGKNGKLDIMDGHNRFYAAKSLGEPIKYTLVNGEVSDDDVYLINRTQRRWSTADFIKSYARMGKKEYIKVAEFMERHRCGAPIACALLANHPYAPLPLVESGKFKVADEDHAEYLMSILQQLNAAVKGSIFRTNFVRAFIKACSFSKDEFDPERFLSQVIKYPHLFQLFSKESDNADNMEMLYNFHKQTSSKVPLSFMIQQAWKK